MKKIPTIFERIFDENGKLLHTTRNLKPEFQWILDGEGEATIKWDGSCCAIIDGEFYRRYDAKNGKTPPEGAIPCQEAPDEITGHWPHWIKVDGRKKEDRWYFDAYMNTRNKDSLDDGTYEAIGPHFQGNPYCTKIDHLIPHGKHPIYVKRTVDGIVEALNTHDIEGIVFWKDGEPKGKIKRSDFDLEWPVKEKDETRSDTRFG